MSDYIIPNIGTSGYYNLLTPFDVKVIATERYTCQSVRRISDYIANNEDVKQIVYLDNGLTEVNYLEDAELNMTIVGLQSAEGHWLYIPVKYISTYPIVNGIPYRSVMIGVALPVLPLARNLDGIMTDINNIIVDTLGVNPVIKKIETSTVIQVDKTQHDSQEALRASISAGRVTDRSRYMKLLIDHQAALDKITALELYIKNHP